MTGSGDELIDGKEDEYAWLEEIDAPDVAITTADIVSKSVAVEFEVSYLYLFAYFFLFHLLSFY